MSGERQTLPVQTIRIDAGSALASATFWSPSSTRPSAHRRSWCPLLALRQTAGHDVPGAHRNGTPGGRGTADTDLVGPLWRALVVFEVLTWLFACLGMHTRWDGLYRPAGATVLLVLMAAWTVVVSIGYSKNWGRRNTRFAFADRTPAARGKHLMTTASSCCERWPPPSVPTTNDHATTGRNACTAAAG